MSTNTPNEETPAAEQTPAPKRKREYIETGEADLKGWFIGLGIVLFLAAAGFVYFMVFHFQDTFYEKQVVEIDLTKRAGG
jgi:flagellar basal body-associated protein FliL